MTLPQIIERTLYPPLAKYAGGIGFDAIGEASTGSGTFSDLVLTIHDERFVVEVKLAKPTTTLGLKAMAQAEGYARKYNTKNFIVLIFPEQYKNQPITSELMLNRIALETKVTCLIFSDFWTESLEGTPQQLLTNLKELIATGKRKIDFKTVVEQIKTFVLELNNVVYQIRTDELISEVVKKLDLFTAIGDVKDKETAKKQITNLSSYLLFNQLLFYHVYQKLTQKKSLPVLQELQKVHDIQEYFNAITNIDYRSIYSTNILGHIPEKREIVDILNDVIKAITLLRAEYVTHDLAGRFFHDLIPHEVRKVLAAFYTHPNSADLLTGLTIDNWETTIIDPACGSGTLIVSSYQTKLRYYQERYGFENAKKIHRQFLEKDINGIDIMPFAAHITTLNLAMQAVEQQTNVVRIASMDALELASAFKSKTFTKGKGIRILGFEKTIQQTLDGGQIVKKQHGAVSMQGKGTEFFLTPTDTVIMNPPFSDREKMPKEMRDKINANEILNKISGSQVNFWGLFLALADLIIKPEGKIGAVLPINLARGEASQQIRTFLLKNYTTEFIIKPLLDKAFSEGASFKDILYIAQKRKPNQEDYTGIVSIKTSIKELPQEHILKIIEALKKCYKDHTDQETLDFEIKFMKTLDLLKYEENLMPLIGMTTQKNKETIEQFLTMTRKSAKNKLMKIPDTIIAEGFHASPAGLSELVFITKPIDSARTERAFMILKKEEKDKIVVTLKDSEITLDIPYQKIHPALRTLTAVKTFNADNIDYVLTQQPEQFNKILQVSKWKGQFYWFEHRKNVEKKESFVVVGRRFRPNSKNTHHFAFYAKNKILSPHTFKILKFENATEAALQTLILNSSITIANILSYREQTTGGFTDIMESELISFDIFNMRNLSVSDKEKLEHLFISLKGIEFPSIIEQYITNNKERRILDTTLLEILGLEEKQIETLLDKLYKTIVEELQTKG